MNPGWRKRCLRLLSLISGNLRLQSSATTYSRYRDWHSIGSQNQTSPDLNRHLIIGVSASLTSAFVAIRGAQRSSNDLISFSFFSPKSTKKEIYYKGTQGRWQRTFPLEFLLPFGKAAVKRGECPYDNMTHKNHMNTPGKMIVSESSKSRIVFIIHPSWLS